ncbi:retrovirus-related pol polyprotein from transposon TNT 1-94 [Tanacetum coccineum]
MANLSEDIQCAGSDTQPPMLDRSDFASWQQRIRLYCRGKKNGLNILKSIDEGPFQMGTFRDTVTEGNEGAMHLGPERPRVYSDLSPEDKDRYNTDIHATNILLQGLPKDIYTLINHYTDAKDIWDNVKMLLEGSELTKEDRELQLNDDFEHFRQNKGETIQEYYVRFAKFVTAVKLNRGLSPTDKLIENLTNALALLTQSYKTHPPQTNNQLRTSSNTRNQATVQDGKNRGGNANHGHARQIKCYNYNGIGHIARNCTQPKRQQNSDYFKDKMLLMQAQENGVVLDEEQLLFLTGGQDTVIDDDVDEPPVQDLALNVENIFQADVFDSDVDDDPMAQTMFMVNLSSTEPIYDEAGPSHDSDILFEVHDHDKYQDAVCEHHEVHEIHDDVQQNCVVDSHDDYTSDRNMISYD